MYLEQTQAHGARNTPSLKWFIALAWPFEI
jgi:hypothetical protein